MKTTEEEKDKLKRLPQTPSKSTIYQLYGKSYSKRQNQIIKEILIEEGANTRTVELSNKQFLKFLIREGFPMGYERKFPGYVKEDHE